MREHSVRQDEGADVSEPAQKPRKVAGHRDVLNFKNRAIQELSGIRQGCRAPVRQ